MKNSSSALGGAVGESRSAGNKLSSVAVELEADLLGGAIAHQHLGAIITAHYRALTKPLPPGPKLFQFWK
jgi:hypothetical protein